VDALRGLLRVDALSGVYETEPVGYTDQPVFWNMVLRVRTDMTAPALLTAVKTLEPALGRVTSFPMGPRAIDIDILLYGEAVIDSDNLKVPHPGLLERAFVLRPLVEIDPALRHPATGERLADVVVPDTGVRRLGAASDMLPGSAP
jgi:2-amino-4-hydroxy-6-hydroxymethyldihydropteridine diphosphokinase